MSKSIDAKKISSPCKKTSREITIAMYLAARHVAYSRSNKIPMLVLFALQNAVREFEEALLPREWDMLEHEIIEAMYLAARHLAYSLIDYSQTITCPLEVMHALEDAVRSFEKEVLGTGMEL